MQEDERAIRDLMATWMRATREGDRETVLSLIAEDALFLLPGHAPITKAAFAETQQAIANVRYEADFEIKDIEISGTLACVWSYLTVEVVMAEGPPMKRAGNVLTVFRSENGKWRLARDANQLTQVDTDQVP